MTGKAVTRFYIFLLYTAETATARSLQGRSTAVLSSSAPFPYKNFSGHLSSCIWNLGVFSGRCTGGSLPLRVDFIHRLEFGELSGHRVLIKRGPGNRGPKECGCDSFFSSWCCSSLLSVAVCLDLFSVHGCCGLCCKCCSGVLPPCLFTVYSISSFFLVVFVFFR